MEPELLVYPYEQARDSPVRPLSIGFARLVEMWNDRLISNRQSF